MIGAKPKHGDLFFASLTVLRNNKSLIALTTLWFCCLVAGCLAIWIPVIIHANIRLDFIDYTSEWAVEPVVWIGWAATLLLYLLAHAFFRTAIIHTSWEYFTETKTSTFRSIIATIIRFRRLRLLVPYNDNARNTLYMPTQVIERTTAKETRVRSQQRFEDTWGSGPAAKVDGTLAIRISLLAIFFIGLIIRHISGSSKRPVNYPDEVHLLLVETKTGTSWIKGGVPTTSSINSFIFGLAFVAVGVSLIWIAAVVVTSIYKVVLFRFATTGECPDEFKGIDLDRAFIMIDQVRAERKVRRAERKRIRTGVVDEIRAERKVRRAERKRFRTGQKQNMLFDPLRTSSPDVTHKADVD
ncbi:MAG: hypothetical protein OXI32_15080 [bacterium]|nr:hypothetical protein [bacterium]